MLMSNCVHQPTNMFLGIRQQNVTFCIDLSGSMYDTLATVKTNLVNYLLEQSVLADYGISRFFNLISFSTEVYPWATSMVLWNKSTVNSCLDWIKNMETKTGTNTLDALLTAFEDSNCHAVVLVTDDISDQEPCTLLNQVSIAAAGRPVHCIYVLKGRGEDRSTSEFLQNLATITKGSMRIVECNGDDGFLKISPICSYDITETAQLGTHINYKAIPLINSNTTPLDKSGTQRIMHNTTTLPIDEYKYPTYVPRVHFTSEGIIPNNAIAWSRNMPVKVLYGGKVQGLPIKDHMHVSAANEIAYTSDAGSLLLNKIVVARCSLDGYYYKGKVMAQLLAHRFMVQFGPNENGKFKDSFFQNTAIYDIIHYDDTISHHIQRDDKVLALVDALEKYAPADVLDGFENRSVTTCNDKPVTVRFANGKTRSCGKNESIWLPDAMHDRIQFELNLPSTARKYLSQCNDDYPYNSLPGYPTNQIPNTKSDFVVMPRMVYDIWPYFVPYYPLLYSNLNCPEINSGSKQSEKSNPNTYNDCTNNGMAPTYYRKMRTNSPSVNADCLNRSVIGTTLTPSELDEKIRSQIEFNNHLINIQPSAGSCLSKRPQSMYQISPCQGTRPQDEHDHIQNIDANCHHNNTTHEIANDRCQINSNSELNHCSNNEKNHYKKYQHLIQHLYKDAKLQESCTSSPLNFVRSNNNADIKRSKSVTFYGDTISNDICRNENRQRSQSPECTGRSQKIFISPKILKNNLKNSENRFGNPKVCVGLPEKSFYRTRSAKVLSNLNQSVQGNIGMKERFKQESYARREKGTVENLLNEQNKQDKREKFRQHLTQSIQESEKNRSEVIYEKGIKLAKAKQEAHTLNRNRMDLNKFNMEAKEQQKVNFLRNGYDTRVMNQNNITDNQTIKQDQKLDFKRNQKEQLNMSYHNRILNNEAVRMNDQIRAEKFHNQNIYRNEAREKKNQNTAALKESIKSTKQTIFQANVMEPQ